ncbi:MAG: hypothetical protein ACFFD1_11720 [Candidatus Thorarchaeota archaeon]
MKKIKISFLLVISIFTIFLLVLSYNSGTQFGVSVQPANPFPEQNPVQLQSNSRTSVSIINHSGFNSMKQNHNLEALSIITV